MLSSNFSREGSLHAGEKRPAPGPWRQSAVLQGVPQASAAGEQVFRSSGSWGTSQEVPMELRQLDRRVLGKPQVHGKQKLLPPKLCAEAQHPVTLSPVCKKGWEAVYDALHPGHST